MDKCPTTTPPDFTAQNKPCVSCHCFSSMSDGKMIEDCGCGCHRPPESPKRGQLHREQARQLVNEFLVDADTVELTKRIASFAAEAAQQAAKETAEAGLYNEDGSYTLNARVIAERAAEEAATQGQVAGIERAAEVCSSYAKHFQELQKQAASKTDEYWVQQRYRIAGLELAMKIRLLSPDANYLDRVRSEAATSALEQERKRIQQIVKSIRDELSGSYDGQAEGALDDVIAAMGNDKEQQQ